MLLSGNNQQQNGVLKSYHPKVDYIYHEVFISLIFPNRLPYNNKNQAFNSVINLIIYSFIFEEPYLVTLTDIQKASPCLSVSS